MSRLTPTFDQLIGAVVVLGIVGVLAVAALVQGNHDALVALIAFLTGSAGGVVVARN